MEDNEQSLKGMQTKHYLKKNKKNFKYKNKY